MFIDVKKTESNFASLSVVVKLSKLSAKYPAYFCATRPSEVFELIVIFLGSSNKLPPFTYVLV